MVIMDNNEKDRTIFCGNLHHTITEELLYELFLQAGPLEKVTIASDKDGRKKGFGFITFKHVDSVPYTIQLMNGIRLSDKKLNLQIRPGSIHESEQRKAPEMPPGNQFRPVLNQHMNMQATVRPPLIPALPGQLVLAPTFNRSASMPENVVQPFLNGPPPPHVHVNSVLNPRSGSNSPADNRLGGRPHPLIDATGQGFQFPPGDRSRQESMQFDMQRQQFMHELDRQMTNAQNRGSQTYQPHHDRHENWGRQRDRQGERDYRPSDTDYRSADHDYRGAREAPGYRRQERRENRNYDNRRRH